MLLLLGLSCQWGNITWTNCSATCGGGFQVGIRHSQGDNCTGEDVLVKNCNPESCPVAPPGKYSFLFHLILINSSIVKFLFNPFVSIVNCTWGAWSSWGSCSKTCSGGSQMRTRSVSEQARHGGACPGPSSDLRGCNPELCPPGKWSFMLTVAPFCFRQKYFIFDVTVTLKCH